MKALRHGLILGVFVLAASGCTGESFSSLEEGDSAQTEIDASADAQTARDGSNGEEDAATDGVSDAGSDAAAHADGGDADDPEGDAATDATEDVTDETEVDAEVDAADDPDADSEADAGDASDESEIELDAGQAGDAAPIDACTPVTWYEDLDGDGWGKDDVSIEACERPAGPWVTKGGDCHDGNIDVHPGQTAFFDLPYIDPNTSQESFDYDCNGTEQGDGEPTTTEKCDAIGIGIDLFCSGNDGYLPATPPRSGPGVNAYCGSTMYFTCRNEVFQCKKNTSTAAALRCR